VTPHADPSWVAQACWVHTEAVIRLGTPADLSAAGEVYRRASLSNGGDRGNLLAHPEHLILGPQELAEGRTYVTEEDGASMVAVGACGDVRISGTSGRVAFRILLTALAEAHRTRRAGVL
jgi:hypothetical protein